MPGPYFPDPAAEALRDPAFSSSGYAADSAGNVIEMLKSLLGNFPITVPSRGLPIKAADGGLAGTSDPVVRIELDTVNAGSFISNSAGASTVSGTVVTTWDSTEKQWYFSNTNGSVTGTGISNGGAMGAVLSALSGPFSRPNVFDMNGGLLDDPELATNLDTLVVEFSAAFRNTNAADNDFGIGFQNGGGAGAMSTNRHIVAARRATGWALQTADGTTRSETVEGADTSNNAKNIFRIEFEDKATPEARLYVGGALKVTKTTNLPAIGGIIGTINSFRWGAPAALATDGLRLYSGVRIYWKNTP